MFYILFCDPHFFFLLNYHGCCYFMSVPMFICSVFILVESRYSDKCARKFIKEYLELQKNFFEFVNNRQLVKHFSLHMSHNFINCFASLLTGSFQNNPSVNICFYTHTQFNHLKACEALVELFCTIRQEILVF